VRYNWLRFVDVECASKVNAKQVQDKVATPRNPARKRFLFGERGEGRRSDTKIKLTNRAWIVSDEVMLPCEAHFCS
jgi:hypothetical protein